MKVAGEQSQPQQSASGGKNRAGKAGDVNIAAKGVSSVLFVCTMNAIRSPLAERILKKYFGNQIYCDSAGTEAGDQDGFAIAAAEERGLDLKSHTSKTIEEMEDSYFDLIITLSPQAHHRVLDLTSDLSVEVEYWPTLDPSTVAGSRDQIFEAYRELVSALEERILARFSTGS